MRRFAPLLLSAALLVVALLAGRAAAQDSDSLLAAFAADGDDSAAAALDQPRAAAANSNDGNGAARRVDDLFGGGEANSDATSPQAADDPLAVTTSTTTTTAAATSKPARGFDSQAVLRAARRAQAEADAARCASAEDCSARFNYAWALRYQATSNDVDFSKREAVRLGVLDASKRTRAELLSLELLLRSLACTTPACAAAVRDRRRWTWAALIVSKDDMTLRQTGSLSRPLSDVIRACTYQGECSTCKGNSSACVELLQVLFVTQMIAVWNASNATAFAHSLLSDSPALEAMAYDANFTTLRKFFEAKMDSCNGQRSCRRALYPLTMGFLQRQIGDMKAAIAWADEFSRNFDTVVVPLSGAIMSGVVNLIRDAVQKMGLLVLAGLQQSLRAVDPQSWMFHKVSTLPEYYVPGMAIAAALVLATLAVFVLGLVRKTILRDGLQALILLGVFLICSWRLVFWTLQPLLSSVSLDVGDDRLFIGPMGATADFAERVVPLFFALTLFVFLYQWLDAVMSYFGGKPSHPFALALILLGSASSLLVAGLTLSIGAATIQGSFTNAADVVTAQQVADSTWVRGNNVLLLVWVTIPVLLNATLLVMCLYAVWQLQRATSKEMPLLRAAFRMSLILTGMVACDLARAVIIFYDVFVGAPPALKYYVGYMVAEALPLVAVLALVAQALWMRPPAVQKPDSSHTNDDAAPLLDPAAYDY